jgi:hypothetical protein
METLTEYLRGDLVKARVRLNAWIVEDNIQGIAFEKGVIATISTTLYDIIAIKASNSINSND